MGGGAFARSNIIIKRPKKYIFKGIYKVLDGNRVHITELPIGYWTDDFKQHIENLMENDKSKKVTNNYIFYSRYKHDNPPLSNQVLFLLRLAVTLLTTTLVTVLTLNICHNLIQWILCILFCTAFCEFF